MFQCPDTQLERSRSAMTGIICPLVTPFVSETGAIDEGWIPRHLHFLEAHNINGVLVAGTTGEGPSLSMEERMQVMDSVIANCGRMFVMAGTGCAALSETIALSRYAIERGIEVVMVMPPFYFKGVDEAAVLRYYQAVCDALPASAHLILYHIPQVTAVPITPPVIEGLLQSHPQQFYGIKDSGGDAQHTADLVQRYPGLNIYSGSDSHLASAIAHGVTGVISALSNAWPDLVSELVDECMNEGDVAAAQERLTAVRKLAGSTIIPVLKAVQPWTSGLPAPSVRLPLQNCSEEEVAHLQAALHTSVG